MTGSAEDGSEWQNHGIASAMMHGFDWSKWTNGKPSERLALIPAGQEHIFQQEDGKPRFVQVVTELSSAFALCAASDEAVAVRDDVSLLTHPPSHGGFSLRAACGSLPQSFLRRQWGYLRFAPVVSVAPHAPSAASS